MTSLVYTILFWLGRPKKAAAEALPGVPAVQEIGDLRIDRRAHSIDMAGGLISLTPSEYNVMLVLAARAGQAIYQFSNFMVLFDPDSKLYGKSYSG